MKEKIFGIIKKWCALEEYMSAESLILDLSIDSLSFVGLLVDIENEFGIAFDFEQSEISAWEKAGDIVKAVEEKINAKK